MNMLYHFSISSFARYCQVAGCCHSLVRRSVTQVITPVWLWMQVENSTENMTYVCTVSSENTLTLNLIICVFQVNSVVESNFICVYTTVQKSVSFFFVFLKIITLLFTKDKFICVCVCVSVPQCRPTSWVRR